MGKKLVGASPLFVLLIDARLRVVHADRVGTSGRATVMVILPRVLALACALGTAHGAGDAVARTGATSVPREIRSCALPLPCAAAATRTVSTRRMMLTSASDGAPGQRARAAEEHGRARQAHCSAL